MNEKGRGGSGRSALEAGLMKTIERIGENPDDHKAFAENYLADIASAMYYFAQGDGDASMDTRLVKMEGLANVVCTKLFPVKVTRRRLLCKRLPRKTRTLIRATRWAGFGMSLRLAENPRTKGNFYEKKS